MIATFARMGHNILLAAFALITIAFVLQTL
jgi:hypothetical protein